jgi:Flp pilus assembly protein TadD
MKRSPPRLWIVVGALGLVGVVWVSLSWWRSTQERALRVASIPPRPDLKALPVELQQRVARCERDARNGPNPMVALGELIRLYHANGFLAEASQGYRGLLRLDARNPQWPHLLANILAGFGQSDEAIPLFQRTLALAPAYVPARLRLGDVQLKSNNIAAADDAYSAVLKQEPDNLYALLGLARCDIAADRWTEARGHLRKAISQNPDIGSVWTLYATVSEKLGDEREAKMALTAVKGTRRFREPPDPWVDALILECYDPYRISVAAAVASAAGDMQKARNLFERAVSLAPEDASLHQQLGMLLYQVRKDSEARTQLERAVALAPEESDNWVYLIAVLNAVGDGAAAERALAAGLARCPKSPSLHSELGRRLKAAGRFEEALAAFAESRRLGPAEPAPYIERALIFFRLNRDQEAVAELRGALNVEPEYPFALSALARYAISTGDETGAAEWLARARRQSRVPPADLEDLAQEFQRRFGRAP